MALTSMTGFARSDGSASNLRWTWEMRSVNGKGLDVRLRLPELGLAREADPQRLVEAENARRGRGRGGLGGCGRREEDEGEGEGAHHSNLSASMGSSCEAFRAG